MKKSRTHLGVYLCVRGAGRRERTGKKTVHNYILSKDRAIRFATATRKSHTRTPHEAKECARDISLWSRTRTAPSAETPTHAVQNPVCVCCRSPWHACVRCLCMCELHAIHNIKTTCVPRRVCVSVCSRIVYRCCGICMCNFITSLRAGLRGGGLRTDRERAWRTRIRVVCARTHLTLACISIECAVYNVYNTLRANLRSGFAWAACGGRERAATFAVCSQQIMDNMFAFIY